MALTADFKQSLQSGATGAAPDSTGGVMAGQAMNPEQFKSWSGAGGGSYLSDVTKNLEDTFTGGAKSITSDVANIKPNAEAAGGGAGGSGAANFAATAAGAGHVAGDIAGTAGGIIGSFISPLLSEEAKSKLGSAADTISQKINAIPGMTPEIAKSLGDVFNTTSLLGGAKAAPKVANAASGVKTALTPSAEAPAAAAAARAAQEQAQLASKVQGVADEWKLPTVPGKVNNPASFNKARDILAQSPDTPKFLTEQKLHPAQHIENGRYATADSADALRDTAGQMSRDTLRPSLQMADYATPKTSVVDALKAAIKNISRDPNVTQGNRAAMTAKLTREASLLEKKYPEGMSLTDMHDEGITYSKNGKYKPNGSHADDNISTANRNLGTALGDLVKSKAPEGLDVTGFQKYLSQYYKAADYLDALDTKKAPTGFISAIAQKSAKIGGFLAGHALGGGVLPGVAGYAMGGALEHAIENMTSSMRGQFLHNLKITNPKAFDAVSKYISDEEAARATRLALPPGKTIALPSEVKESSVKSVRAQKNPTTVNPKTGKFQTSYNSSVKE